ncbi:MAG: hypothetical protein JWN48_4552 [Myxococcaceae bacterium]|nr:hypothetical protein [Myxococcaceae bacterium]
MPWLHKTVRYSLLLGLSAPLLGSCGDDAVGGSPRPEADGDGSGANSGGTTKDAGAKAPTSTAADGMSLPPEVEQPLSFETPQAGKTSVYVPNPSTNHVAVVNAGTFNIENLAVGGAPTFAATVPGQDVALVLNVQSRDAALLRTNEQGKTDVKQLAVGHDANAIAIAPDGKHAVLYPNAAASGATGTSFQDLTIVDLTAGMESSKRVSVGFRPRGVQFSKDGNRAFVITEDGISILDFTALAEAPSIARLVSLGDTLADAQSIDVQVTPDGAFALSRRDGDSTLRLINLTDGTIKTLALGSLPLSPINLGDGGVPAPATGDAGVASGTPELTDLDLSPDGSFAIAVLRDRGALVRIPLPGGFSDPSLLSVRLVKDQLIGSVTLSASGTRAVAYTTAAPIESVVVVDLTSDAPPRGIKLRKAVRAVALTSDGTRALVLHAAVGTAISSNEDSQIDASEGYSLVDTTTGFAKLQLTPARVGEQGLLLTPDGLRVFSLLNNGSKGTSGSVRSVEMADLQTFQVSSVELSTAPTSIGLVPGLARVFVGQLGEGGITFLDASTGVKIRSVSGFEIASRIRQ